ncbi:L,D-transpeptidase [Williamsia sterculiae]|uniref:L,D-transpeptidase catalytic domain n=1 Tax=Williamsia sterculiae TaxID=1344003 RepID=A0A1N7G413_9NOCA|nr:L,D-transpeptidase [Williamsia sterculiae]SIS07186.1 L,D-transpeptidase catalytic domain [Williamsia sterculiae]
MVERGSGPQIAALREHRWTVMLVVVAAVASVLVLVQAVRGQESSAQLAATDAPGGAVVPPAAAATPPPVLTAATDACRGNTAPQLVKVSLGQQHMWMCQLDKPVDQSPVTTGSVDRGDGTPLGTWQIESRETRRFLDGPDYRVFVDYWLPFFEDFGFHDSPWQKFPYGDRSLYKVVGSRGCVHVPTDAMAALYRWANVGTTVTVTT